MSRANNPYHVNSGPYEGIGQGIANLGQIFLGQQDPVRQAQAEQAAWAARNSREGVTDTVMARDGRLRMGEQLSNFDPNADNRSLIGGAVGAGSMDPQNLGRLFHMMNANFGGTDEQVGRSHVGMGNTIGTGDAFSLPDREGVAQRAQDFALEGQRAQDAGAMARLLQTQRFTGAQNDLDRAADAENPLAGIDWLDETRRSSVESDIGGTFDMLAEGVGITPNDLPPELVESMFSRSMQLLQSQRMGPREAAAAAWQEHGVEATPGSGGFFGFGRSDPSVNFQRPAARQPAAPAQGGGPVPGQTRYTDPDDGTTYLFRGGDPNDPNSWETVQ